MKLKHIPLALSVGIIATLWTYASIKMGWPTWAAFVSWAFFFVAGGDTKAIMKASVPLICGVLFGYASLYGLKAGEGDVANMGIAVGVGVAAAILVIMTNWPVFALAPAAFGAFAVFFAVLFGGATGHTDVFNFTHVIITICTLLIGVGLGWLSTAIPGMVAKGA